MVVHLSTGACEALKRAAITDPAYSGRRFRGRTGYPRSGARLETTGGGLPVRVQKLAVGNPGRLSHPAAVPPKEAAAEEGIRRGRQSGLSHFLTRLPFLLSAVPALVNGLPSLAARLSQGIRNPCARFDIRLPHPPSSLWGRPSFFKNTNPRRGQIGSICPAGGFFICCIIRTDRQTSCLRHRPAEWERKWAASWGAARWFPHR